MAGLVVFTSLNDALKEGYQVYDRTRDGYIVRRRNQNGWAMAIVDTTEAAKGRKRAS